MATPLCSALIRDPQGVLEGAGDWEEGGPPSPA